MKSRSAPTATSKRLCDIFHAVFIMLREGLAKRRLHFLLHQGKLATRSLRSLLSHYHPSSIHSRAVDTFSCRFMDPDAAIIAPREIEFSCSNTPFYAAARKRTQHVSSRRERRDVYDAAAVARAFEILDSVPDDGGVVEEMATPLLSVLATPSASVRQLRVTDSPFPLEEEKETDEVVDLEAEEFIRQFYEQLRRQQMRCY